MIPDNLWAWLWVAFALVGLLGGWIMVAIVIYESASLWRRRK